MRLASTLSTLVASVAFVAAPLALAQQPSQSADGKALPKAATPAAKPAAKPADSPVGQASKANKVEGAAAVRTTPADMKKSGEKSEDGCSYGKTAAASDA